MDVFEGEWDFFEKCRTCRKTGKLQSVTNEIETDLTVMKMLQICTFITISESDELPDQICTNCCDELARAYKFVTKCEESERKIQNYIEKLVEQVRNEDYLKHGLKKSFRKKRTIGRYRLKVKEYLRTEKLKYKRNQVAINISDTAVSLATNNDTCEASVNISADLLKKDCIKSEPLDVDDVGSLAASNIANLPTLEQENSPTEEPENVPTLEHGNLPTSERETLPTLEQTKLPTEEHENLQNKTKLPLTDESAHYDLYSITDQPNPAPSTHPQTSSSPVLPIDATSNSVLGSKPPDRSKIDPNLIIPTNSDAAKQLLTAHAHNVHSANNTVFIKNEIHQSDYEEDLATAAKTTTNLDENTVQDGHNFNFTPVDVPMRHDEIKLEATDALDQENSTQDMDDRKKSQTTTKKTHGKIVKLKMPITASSKLSTVIRKLSNTTRKTKLKLLFNSSAGINNEGELVDELAKKLSNSKLIKIGKQPKKEHSNPSVDHTNYSLSSLIQYNFSSLIQKEPKPVKSRSTVKDKQQFKCEKCHRTFTRLHYLNSHVTYVHELNQPRPLVRKKFQCDRCLVIFFNQKLLDQHMHKHHGHIMTHLRRRKMDEKPFRCVDETAAYTTVQD